MSGPQKVHRIAISGAWLKGKPQIEINQPIHYLQVGPQSTDSVLRTLPTLGGYQGSISLNFSKYFIHNFLPLIRY